VPLLRLNGLSEQLASQQQEADEGSDGGHVPLMTPGRASARTRARAQLRAKKRASKREETAMATAREAMVETVWEEETDTIEDSPQRSNSPRGGTSPACGGAGPCINYDIEDEDEVSDVSDSSDGEEGAIREVGMAAMASRLPTGAWEYPLSVAERKARVLMLFGRNEVLGDCQIRRGERLAEKLRAQVRLHRRDMQRLRDDADRLRRERNDVCGKAAALRSENSELKEKVRELQRRAQQQSQSEAPPASARTPWKPSPAAASAPGMVPALPAFPGWIPAAVDGWIPAAVPALPAFPAFPAAPMTGRSQCANASPTPNMSRTTSGGGSFASSSRTSCTSNMTGPSETPRSMGLVTPRTGGARACMRGAIQDIYWAAQACQVPWVMLTSRGSAFGEPTESLYGERDHGEQEAFSAAHLRRGEFISSISGSWSNFTLEAPGANRQYPPIARYIRIITSEKHEIEIGEVSSEVSFCFEAEPGHEITGLAIQDGIICGVKQAVLAPSRVSLAPKASPQMAPIPSAAQPPQPDGASLPAQVESRQKAEERQRSLEVLIRGQARRKKEAEEAVD